MQRNRDAVRGAAFGVLLFALVADPVTARCLRGETRLEPALNGNIPRTLPPSRPAATPVDTQTLLDTFAWQNFIAVMWPSLAHGDGAPYEPDDPGVFGHYDALLVPAWMRWKTAFDLYPPDGSEPPPWDQPSGHAICRNVPAGDRRPRLDMVSESGHIADGIGDAFAGPLTSRANHGTRIDLRMNRVEYDYVRSNGYYDRSNWPARDEPPISFPASTSDRLGAIEVRATWRTLEPLPQKIRSRVFTIDALAADPGTCSTDGSGRTTCNCEPMKAGLVGFHISHKIAEFQQWIGATFGQVDHVGEDATTAPDMPAHLSPERYPMQPLPRADPTDHPDSGHTPWPSDHDPPPTDAVRPPEIPGTIASSTTSEINTHYRRRLQGTVWQHYVLISTQWSTAPPVPPAAPLDDDAGCERGMRLYQNDLAFPQGQASDVTMQTDRE